jgi:hypothetical protein
MQEIVLSVEVIAQELLPFVETLLRSWHQQQL